VSLRAVGLLFGLAFGFVLGWARLTDYDVIRNMLLLREPDVFLLMMSAIATAAIGARALRLFKVTTVLDRTPIAWTVEAPRARHVVGSVVFGVGWSVAATCPGPVAAQVGRGQFAGLFTMAGLLVGIAICDRVRGRRSSAARPVALGNAANVAARLLRDIRPRPETAAESRATNLGARVAREEIRSRRPVRM
jgi:uncharacterized membrane protein YedE/YeeE